MQRRARLRVIERQSLRAETRRETLLFFALAFTLLLATHASLLSLPYFWDEAGYYIPAAHDLLLTGDIIPHSTAANPHPPLVIATLAAAWKILGYSPVVTRTAMLLWAAFGLTGLFLLARRIANREVALATCILTALYPVFFAQSVLAHLDLPAAALTFWGLHFYFGSGSHNDTPGAPAFGASSLRDKEWEKTAPGAPPLSPPLLRRSGWENTASGAPPWPTLPGWENGMCALCFSLAALAKETAVLAPLALLAFELALKGRAFRPAGRELREEAALADEGRIHFSLLIPLLPLALWFLYQYARTGHFLGDPGFVSYNLTTTLLPLRFSLALLTRLWHLFGHMSLFVLTAAMLLAMLFPPLPEDLHTKDARRRVVAMPLRERIDLRTQLALAAVILAYVVSLSVVGGAVLARYMLPVVPLFILIAVSTLRRRIPFWRWIVAIVAVAFVAATLLPLPYRYAPEDNLAWRDFVLLHQQAAQRIQNRFPNARVLTAWPASDELTRPYLGYVRQPLRVTTIDDFSPTAIDRAAARSDYDLAFVFSTKLEPPGGSLLDFIPGWRRAHARFFGLHQDLPPDAIAALLHGRIVWQEKRGPQWAALIEFPRVLNAHLQGGWE